MTAAARTLHQHPVRPAVPDDLPFIGATWVQSYWQESPWGNRIRWQIFRRGHDKVIRSLLTRSQVLVAHDPSDENEITGYFVYEPAIPAAHWTYVKPAFRKAGIASALLAASGLPHDLSGVSITHATRAWLSLPEMRGPGGSIVRPMRPGIEEHFPKSIHDPYIWLIQENTHA